MQSRVAGLLCRHSGCRAGQRDASRIRMPASNPTLRAVEWFSLAAVRAGLVRYARAGETVRAAGASRHRAARAREVLVMESFLSARAAGKLVAGAPRKATPLNAAKEKNRAGVWRAVGPGNAGRWSGLRWSRAVRPGPFENAVCLPPCRRNTRSSDSRTSRSYHRRHQRCPLAGFRKPPSHSGDSPTDAQRDS